MSVIYLRPISTNTDPGGLFLKTGGATVHDCIDDLVGAPDEATTMVSHTTIAYWVVPETMPTALSIASVALITRVRERGGGVNSSFTPTIRIAGINYAGAVYGPTADNSWVYRTDTWLLDPSTGLAWTTTGVRAVLMGGTGVIVADEMDVTQQYLSVDFVPASVRIGAARDNGSRFTRLFRRPVALLDLKMPLRFGDAELLDDVTLTHFAYPTPDDLGAGSKPWQRVVLRKLSEELDLATLTMRSRFLVVRDYLALFWDTMIAEQPPAFSDGIARLDPGAGRTFTRASSAWIENAATAAQGTKQVVEVATNAEKQTTSGLLIENGRTNQQIQSSFKNALTGWTSAGTGSNGSAIAADTTDLLFEAVTSGNSVKFTAGTPIHVADLQVTGTATAAFNANSTVTVSIDHKDDSGAALSVAIQRGIDANYWRESDSTWQVAKTWNTMTASTTPARWASKNILPGVGATTLTAIIGIPTATGVAGQINHLYHVQIEGGSTGATRGKFPTSRILTAAAAVARADDLLTVENFHGRRIFLPEHGYVYCEFMPEWASADAAAGPAVWAMYYSATLAFLLGYVNPDFVFRFIGAATVSATKTTTVVRDTVYKLGCRWTGPDAEEDLPAYTLSIFVNGVKGTDVVYAPASSFPSSPLLYIGTFQAGTNICDGWIRNFVIGQAVLSDEEMANLP
jgi:hypothetical protein